MAQECPNCGWDCSRGDYTPPWADGDNEYGYWICPHCREEVTDWASGDD